MVTTLRLGLLIGLLSIASCATQLRPIAIVGVAGCSGYVGDLIILSDGTILTREDPKSIADKVAEALGPTKSRMVYPDECPPTQSTRYEVTASK